MKKRTSPNKKGEVTLNEIVYRPIGIIHTPFRGIGGTPNQPIAGKGIEGIQGGIFNQQSSINNP